MYVSENMSKVYIDVCSIFHLKTCIIHATTQYIYVLISFEHIYIFHFTTKFYYKIPYPKNGVLW